MRGRLPLLAAACLALRRRPAPAAAVRLASSSSSSSSSRRSIPATVMPATGLPASVRCHGPSASMHVHARRGLASAAAAKDSEEDGGSVTKAAAAAASPAGGGAQDEAAQRRLEALKRFGVSAAGQGTQGKPIARAVPPKNADGKEEPEPDWNEIWGDYIEYMDNQRNKGWKT